MRPPRSWSTPAGLSPLLLTLVVGVSLATPADPARAEPLLISGGDVSRVAAAADGTVTVVRDDGAVLVGDVRRLAALPREAGAEALSETSDRLPNRLESNLDDLDVPFDEWSSWAARDLLEDDLPLTEARALRGRSSPSQQTRPVERAAARLAPAPDGVYVISGRALWFVDALTGAQRRSRVTGRIGALAATAQGRVAMVRDGAVVVSLDGGRTFHALPAGLPRDADTGAGAAPLGPIEHIAWSSDGRRLACAARESVGWCSSLGERVTRLPAHVRDLRACAGALLALTGEGLFAVSSMTAPPRRLSEPLRGQRVVCDPSGAWLVIDPGIAGAPVGPGPLGASGATNGEVHGEIHDLAFGPDGIWIASPAGLLLLPNAGAFAQVSAQGLLIESAPIRLDPPRPPPWLGLLPEFAVRASVSGSAERRDLLLMGTMTFPLGRSRPMPPAEHFLRAAQVSSAESPSVEPNPERRPTHLASPATPAALRALDAEATACLASTRRRATELAQVEPERARSLIRRAAQGAWLPELRLRVDRRLGRSESASLGSSPASTAPPLGLDTANDLRYEARAIWDLGRLIFSPDEIAAGTQALRMADMRRDLESLIVRLFFERRRLVDAAWSAERELRGQEISAELDALSDGHFSRCASHAPPQSASPP